MEYLFPYAFSASDLKAQLQNNHLQQVLFNLPAGEWSLGERGIAANPGRINEFKDGVALAMEYAQTLGVHQVNCLAGKRLPQYSKDEQWLVLVDNLRFAATALQTMNMRLVIEPINHYDMPDFIINRTEQAVQLIEAVARPNLFIQYDVYHAQREEGEIISTLRKHIEKIGHIQIADNPGRHQPGTGELYYPAIFKAIDELGYQGYLGLEYIPAGDTLASLNWVSDFGYTL